MKNYTSYAITIFLIGAVLALLSSLYLPDKLKLDGTAITITMTFLAIAFSYYQYHLNKIETEKRKLSDLKLMVYKEIMRKCDDLIADCQRLIYAEFSKQEANLGYIIIDLPTKKYVFSSTVVLYQDLLNINLQNEHYVNLNEAIKYLEKNKISSEGEYISNSKKIIKLVSEFNMSIYKILIK